MITKEAMRRSPFPLILGADLNSVPASYPYHILSAGLQDAIDKMDGVLEVRWTVYPKHSVLIFCLLIKNC